MICCTLDQFPQITWQNLNVFPFAIKRRKTDVNRTKSIEEKSPQTEGNILEPNKPWKCGICLADFSDKPTLVRHITTEHVKVTPPRCTVCGTSLILKEAAIEHIEQHAPMQCALCKEEDIPTFAALEEHLLNKHSDDKMCTICRTEIDHSKDLVTHMIQHQKKQNRRKCPTCLHYHPLPNPNLAYNRGSMNKYTHCLFKGNPLMKHNIKGGTLECCFCSYMCEVDTHSMRMHITHEHGQEVALLNNLETDTDNVGRIVRHVSTKHRSIQNRSTKHMSPRAPGKNTAQSDRVWKCNICDTSFRSQNPLLTHFFVEHIKRTGPTCIICGASIYSYQSAIDHIQIHAPMQCALCKQENLWTLVELEEHLRVKHASDKMCPICQTNIDHSGEIAAHMIEHQKKLNKRKCPTCLGYHVIPANMKGVLIKHNIKFDEYRCCLCMYTCPCLGGSYNMRKHLTSVHREHFVGVVDDTEHNAVKKQEHRQKARHERVEIKELFVGLHRVIESHITSTWLVKQDGSKEDTQSVPQKSQILNDAIKLVDILKAQEKELQAKKKELLDHRSRLVARYRQLGGLEGNAENGDDNKVLQDTVLDSDPNTVIPKSKVIVHKLTERRLRQEIKEKFFELHRVVASYNKSIGLVNPWESSGYPYSVPPKSQILNDAIKLVYILRALEGELKAEKKVLQKRRGRLAARFKQLWSQSHMTAIGDVNTVLKDILSTSDANQPDVKLGNPVQKAVCTKQVNLVSKVSRNPVQKAEDKQPPGQGDMTGIGDDKLLNYLLSNSDTNLPDWKLRNPVKNAECSKQRKLVSIVSKDPVKKTEATAHLKPASMANCKTPAMTKSIPYVVKILPGKILLMKPKEPTGTPDCSLDQKTQKEQGQQEKLKLQSSKICFKTDQGSTSQEGSYTKVKQCKFCLRWISEPLLLEHLNKCTKQRLGVGKRWVPDRDVDRIRMNGKLTVRKSNTKFYKLDYGTYNKYRRRYLTIHLLDISKVSKFQFESKRSSEHLEECKSELDGGDKRYNIHVEKCSVCERWIIGEDSIRMHQSKLWI